LHKLLNCAITPKDFAPDGVMIGPIMHSTDLIDAGLRVLAALDHGHRPDEGDLQLLKGNAQPDELILPLEELAGELIKRAIAKRRSARAGR
jgi:hypothetical protein